MGYDLKRVSERFILHDVFIKLSFFFVVTVKLILESFDVVGHETDVLELGQRCSVFAKDVVEAFDRFIIEDDVP